MSSLFIRATARSAIIILAAVVTTAVSGQENPAREGIVSRAGAPNPAAANQAHTIVSTKADPLNTTAGRHADPAQGASSGELIQRALTSNTELAAVRLDIERARARLRQAGLRSNPTVEFEQATGKPTGSAGERETSIGFSLPLEINGQRKKRVSLAQAELAAVEAEVADRERRFIAEMRSTYAEALAAVRELEITEGLNNIDLQTARIVEARVTEGESAPLELNLLRAEVDRLRSRRAIVEGRLQVILLRLKSLAGIPLDEPLRLREDLFTPVWYKAPASLEAALDIALKMRPDLHLARLNEKVSEAGLELARAQGRPAVTAFSRYSTSRSSFDDTPVGALRDKDRILSFGVSISVPLFNRNQGAKAEAATAISQAQRRREFIEQLVRAEVAGAYARYEAAQAALAIFEQGVLARSIQNTQAMRGAYELGAFRLTELLVEQRRLLDSQREYTETLAERYKALADLSSAIGTPLNATAK